MHRDLLPVQVLPVLVELGVDHREEAQRAHLVEDADRRLDLLQHRVGRAHADIGLPADHGLGGDVLGLEVGDLDVDAALLGALDRDQEVQGLDGRDVAEGDPDLARGGRGRRQLGGGQERRGGQAEQQTPVQDHDGQLPVAPDLCTNQALVQTIRHRHPVVNLANGSICR